MDPIRAWQLGKPDGVPRGGGRWKKCDFFIQVFLYKHGFIRSVINELSTQKMAFCLSLKMVVSHAVETWIFEVAGNVFHKFSNCARLGKQLVKRGRGACRMTSLPSRLYLFNSSPLVHVRFPGEEGGRARGQFVCKTKFSNCAGLREGSGPCR